MGILDRLFGATKKVDALEKQVKALQGQNLGMIINATTSIYPTWQTLENITAYTTIDDVYSVISFIADTAARVPMYGYEVVDDMSAKMMRKSLPESVHGKYYRRKALNDLSENDKFGAFMKSISYADKVKWYSLLYMNGELFLWKEVVELGPNRGKVYLHVLDSSKVTVIISEDFPQRVIGYKYFDMGFDGTFRPDEVIHVKYFNPTITNGLQWRGLSPLQVLTRRLTRLSSAMDVSVGQMQNGGVPGIVYEKSDYAIGTLGLRKNDFAMYLRNSANKGAPYFAAGEMGYLQLGLSNADLDIAELANIDFTKICNAYKVPEVLLNNQDSSTYNNVSTALKMLYSNTILPNIYLMRDALEQSILPMFPDRKRVIEIDISEIPAMQEDLKAQADALNAMWWITPNEKRDIQQFERLDAPGMDEIIVDGGKTLLIDVAMPMAPDVTMPTE